MVSEHMFASSTSEGRSLRRDGIDRAALAALKDRVRPLAQSRTRLLPLAEPLLPLTFGEGIRRGSVLAVGGPGALCLALAALAEASRAGMWSAALGVGGLGAVGAAGVGIDLARLALVEVEPASWGTACASLLGGVDLVVAQPPLHLREQTARVLSARARERGALLVIVAPKRWPIGCDLSWRVATVSWEGLGEGSGALSRRRASVQAWRRDERERVAGARLWLPDPSGAVVAL